MSDPTPSLHTAAARAAGPGRRRLGVLALGLALAFAQGAQAASVSATDPVTAPDRPAFPASPAALPAADDDAAQLAAWSLATNDHEGLPFVVIDKRGSRVEVYGADGRLRGTSPALVGATRGDDPIPGIGSRPIASITLKERVTPAGRFHAVMGRGPKGEDILWVDYDQALALHRVVTDVPAEHRLQRLRSPLASERRITYGCINVPVRFFEQVVSPVFAGGRGIVYILPELRPVQTMFGPEAAPAQVAAHDASVAAVGPAGPH